MFSGSASSENRSLQPAGAEFWHLWTVIIPRLSITGRFVRGRVWRRHDGRRWNTGRSPSTKTTDNDVQNGDPLDGPGRERISTR